MPDYEFVARINELIHVKCGQMVIILLSNPNNY